MTSEFTMRRNAEGLPAPNRPANWESTSPTTDLRDTSALRAAISRRIIASQQTTGTVDAWGTAPQGDQGFSFRGDLPLVTNNATRTVERKIPAARRRRA
ncbi:hypothetical protein [Amycolatopsis minnesotensis]|uniref:Uncharacterized protein n=1 Tax=Amycolatopsis minnesotensis TaxID=337894 RepID=A0ABP5CY31_9PSEU